jgi:hypothetical protein
MKIVITENNQPSKNTDREIWRLKPGNYYSTSVFITKDNQVGINSGGTVYVMTPEEWIRRANYFTDQTVRMFLGNNDD